jgi:threonine aldolase
MNVNLISDTVTKPSKEMLDKMMLADVGDDVFKQDPTVNQLEEKVAQMFGMQKALFFPSGTMTNQTAIKILTNPGDQLICSKYSHVYNYEGGGVSFNSGVSCKLIEGERGLFKAKDVFSHINPPDFYHSPKTSLICIENTTNKGGGACWDISELKKIKSICKKNNLFFHLDGARIWNAYVRNRISLIEYGNLFDTISVCLSKGLGCPVGSLLLTSNKLYEKALKIRKILGGGMRQSGILAACGLYALENNIERLKYDQYKATEIGDKLAKFEFIKKVEPVETNIVIFELIDSFSSEYFQRQLQNNGIKIINMGDNKLRIVTHMDYTDENHEYFLNSLDKIHHKS